MARFQVLRKFQGAEIYNPGDEVELDGANVGKLVAQRFLQPLDGPGALQLDAAAPDAPVVAKRGPGRPKAVKAAG